MSIQPLLPPCKGALVDFAISVDPSNPNQLQLYWGTVLLQILPRDPNSLMFRIVAGLLANLKVNMGLLEEHLGVTGKTLRKWRDALVNGDWEPLAAIFHGPGADVKLRPDIGQYVRRRYRDVMERDGKIPYGFRQEIRGEVSHFWGVDISGEALRQAFRAEDCCIEQDRYAVASAPTSPAAIEAVADSRSPCAPVDVTVVEDTLSTPNNEAVASAREEACASALVSCGDVAETRNLAPEKGATDSPEVPCEDGDRGKDEPPPLFAPDAEPSVGLSQHAGLFLLSPWFEEAFAAAEPIIRQTAAQILLGAVNQEQAKHIDYAGLAFMSDGLVRDIDYQHKRLLDVLGDDSLTDVFARNAKLLNLTNERIFFVDPHHKEYTGIEKVLYAWSGKHHDTRKGILLDFIHTRDGAPCFVSHFDNYYDPRDRFRLLLGRFRTLFGDEACGFTWIHDRGYWAKWFLDWISDGGDFFIQWEKDYKEDGWSQPCDSKGKFTICRKRNNRADRLKVKVRWREQDWPELGGGRRLIVRIKRRGDAQKEVAIVTNHPELGAAKVIELMLDRWLQETDFCYLSRHFGIDELGGRLFEDYADIASTLDDRQVKSRQHKAISKQRQKLRDGLSRQLFNLRSLPSVSLEKLTAQREELRAKAIELDSELEQLKAGLMPDRQFHSFSAYVATLTQKLKWIQKNREAAEQRAGIEAQTAKLDSELAEVEAELRQVNHTESRLLALIEEQYVRPDLRKKALLDAIRITCRNVFRQPFDIFRPIYNNHRDDHEILRQLSRSAGIVIRHSDRVVIYLTPALHRQPAQWERIEAFIDICQHRIREKFGIRVRFLLNKTDKEIFAAVARAQAGLGAG